MKKSKLSVGLVTSFIAAMAMSACSSDVTKKDGALVTFTPYGGDSEKVVLTESMYNKYMESSAGISKMYESILEVLIRYDFQKNSEGLSATRESLGSIQSKADNDVKAEKTKAKENAKSNGTSYETEWEAILDSYNVEDAKELKELFVYKREKSEMEDWYFEEHEADLKKEYLGVNADGTAVTPAQGAEYGELTSKFPYHIRHILVKNEDGGSNYNTGTISKEQSLNLVKVVSKLADVNNDQTFGRIALENSEDTSGSKYGDVGIVTNNATEDGSLTMVPEFQLGIYAYDAILSGKSNAVINKGLGLADTDMYKTKKVKEVIASTAFAAGSDSIVGLTEVPYNVFEDLKNVAEMENDKAGHKVLDSDQESVVYPRNILWNKYLNRHNPFIITNRKRTMISNLASVGANANPNTLEAGYDATTVDTFGTKKCGFASAYKLGLTTDATSDMKVLTDENDNVIIGVRSQYGIHFTVIQKSIFTAENDPVALTDYYTTKIPGKDGYPTEGGKDKLTYVNYMKEGQSDYQARADQVKDAIKSFDTTYDYRLYEGLVAKYKNQLTFNTYDGVSMDTRIDTYIKLQREKNALNQEVGMNKAWENYLDMIAQQNAERANDKRMVPEGCAIGFMKDLEAIKATDPNLYNAYLKGGACYYGK